MTIVVFGCTLFIPYAFTDISQRREGKQLFTQLQTLQHSPSESSGNLPYGIFVQHTF